MRHVLVLLTALLISISAAFWIAAATDPNPAHAGVYLRGCSGEQVYLSYPEKRMLELHNHKRRARGLPIFCVHPALQKAARAHSKEMIEKDYFSHYSYNGETFWARLSRYGYDWSRCAENIGWGAGTKGRASYVFGKWMRSSGHRAHILDAHYEEIGIGQARGTYKTYSKARMWSVDFGSR